MAKYNFDWTDFDEVCFDAANRRDGADEDDIYGLVRLDIENVFTLEDDNVKHFLIDVHRYYYAYDDQGYDLEIYTSNKDGRHVKWLASLKDIKSAKSYKRFCRRAENLILKYLWESEGL